MTFALSPDGQRQVDEILTRYPNRQAACIPLLHVCQEESSCISDEVIRYVAELCEVSAAHVEGVATFYSLFSRKPCARHQIWVCRTLSCALRGAGTVVKRCEDRLGIRAGQTTRDGKVALHETECLAACGSGPVMMVDGTYHEELTAEKVDRILDQLMGKSS